MRIGHSLQVVNQVTAYSTELLNDVRRSTPAYDELNPNPAALQVLESQSKVSVAAMGILTKQAYDMAHASDEVVPTRRTAAAELGSLALLLTDIVDDEVDKPEVHVALKHTYLDEVAAHLLQGQQPDTIETPAMHAAHSLAQHLHATLQKHKGLPRFTSVVDSLLGVVKLQFASTDTDEQLYATKEIGALSGEVAAAAVEIVENRSYPDLTIAMRGIGAYGTCLDNALEIAEDVDEGSMCYANVFLAQNGDTPENRELIKRRMLTAGNEALDDGSKYLSREQLAIYRAAKHMLDFKYKILDPVRSCKKRIAAIRTSKKATTYSAAR